MYSEIFSGADCIAAQVLLDCRLRWMRPLAWDIHIGRHWKLLWPVSIASYCKKFQIDAERITAGVPKRSAEIHLSSATICARTAQCRAACVISRAFIARQDTLTCILHRARGILPTFVSRLFILSRAGKATSSLALLYLATIVTSARFHRRTLLPPRLTRTANSATRIRERRSHSTDIGELELIGDKPTWGNVSVARLSRRS